jgi:NAD(P)-dependent dehydrogenase (short-subunit alcohol dehydrogenase family)
MAQRSDAIRAALRQHSAGLAMNAADDDSRLATHPSLFVIRTSRSTPKMTSLFDISGKTALVTGGVNGLGRMITEGLLRAGVKVYVTSRKADAAEKAQRELGALGNCVALVADLASPEAAVAVANQIKAQEPALHILVNNAGRTWGAPLESFPDKAWPQVLTINVQVPFTLVRELLPLLRAAGSSEDPARVINIGSVAAIAVEPLSAYSYAASKAAIHQLTRVMAADLAHEHITVNVIAPGFFPTKMMAHINNVDEEREKLLSRIPLKRLGQPEDIAGLCVFLASRAGSYFTGAELVIDGGLANCR